MGDKITIVLRFGGC